MECIYSCQELRVNCDKLTLEDNTWSPFILFFFFFNDTATTEIYTLSLHDALPICLILWFGWYGFNPGSTLSAMDFEGIGRVAANTTLAACAAGLTAMFWAYKSSKTWDAGFTTNGFLAGLVAITCPCYWVSPTGALLLGGIAGVLVVLGVEALEWFRIDDPIGAVPVHGFCGIWGTLSLGLFACGRGGGAGPLTTDNSAPPEGPFCGGGTAPRLAPAVRGAGGAAA